MTGEAVDTGGPIHCVISGSNNTVYCEPSGSNTVTGAMWQNQLLEKVANYSNTYGSENSQKTQV